MSGCRVMVCERFADAQRAERRVRTAVPGADTNILFLARRRAYELTIHGAADDDVDAARRAARTG